MSMPQFSKNVFPNDVHFLFIDMNLDNVCITVHYCSSEHRYNHTIFKNMKKISVEKEGFNTLHKVKFDNDLQKDIEIYTFLMDDNEPNIKHAMYIAMMNGCKVGITGDSEMENYLDQIMEDAIVVSNF